MDVRFHPEAARELEEAAAEIGAAFIEEGERAVERARATPNAGASWPGLPPDIGVHRRNLPSYKYRSLAYTLIHDCLWIVAIVHERRRPGYWVPRLGEILDSGEDEGPHQALQRS